MANGPTLAPQAYTREVLTTAFNWLQSQPESVRKQATTPDSLVCLYRRAQRYGSATLESEAPVSSMNFMSDLKNLAEGLKEFEGPKAAFVPASAPAPRANATYAQQLPLEAAASMKPLSTSSPIASAPKHVTHPDHSVQARAAGTTAAPTRSPIQEPSLASFAAQASALAATPLALEAMATDMDMTLNERSLAMIQEVKTALNLSCDTEAANMMIALAYKNLKNLLA